MLDSKQNVKYRIFAFVEALHLDKNLKFQTKVTWKRNVNKAETSIVAHQDSVSVFQEQLELELNLVYNPQLAKFQPKMTEFSVTVIYQGKQKSGGYVKFDAADAVNLDYTDKLIKLNLTQCPDPAAYLEVKFNYEVSGDSSHSLFNQLSMLNGSTIEKDLSQINFQQEEQAPPSNNIPQPPLKQREVNKINNILDKFQNLSRRVKRPSNKQEHSFSNSQNMDTTVNRSQCEDSLRNKVRQLQIKIQDLQEKLQDSYGKIQNMQRLLRQRDLSIEELENSLQQNRREMSELQLRLQLMERQKLNTIDKDKLIEIALAQSENKFRSLYEKTLGELQEARRRDSGGFSRQNIGFARLQEEVNEVQEIAEFSQDDDQELKRENVQMQTKIASMSHKIAQLFNAAYQYGGPKLLDYLHASIGLVQS